MNLINPGTYLESFAQHYPVLTYATLTIVSIASVFLKNYKYIHLLKPKSKLDELDELRQYVGKDDKRLNDFIELQTQNELYKKLTGYNNTAINRMIVDLHNSNSDKISWRQIKLVWTKFEADGDRLKLKHRGFWAKFGDYCSYAYFGLIGILLPLAFVIYENKLIFIIAFQLPLLALSTWKTLIITDRINAYKRVLRLLNTIDEKETPNP